MLHLFTQVLFWAGNQGNNQHFDPSLRILATQETLTDFHGDEAKKIPTILNIIFKKKLGIGPWVSRID